MVKPVVPYVIGDRLYSPEGVEIRRLTPAEMSGREPDRPPTDPDDTGFIAPDQAGSMVMLSASIIAGMVLTFGVAIGWGLVHQINGRLDRLQADLKTLQTFASCDAPKRPGDVTVITYRRTETQVAARCQVITNPMDLERTFK